MCLHWRYRKGQWKDKHNHVEVTGNVSQDGL